MESIYKANLSLLVQVVFQRTWVGVGIGEPQEKDQGASKEPFRLSHGILLRAEQDRDLARVTKSGVH